MDDAILEYCRTDLRESLQPSAIATETAFQSVGTAIRDFGRKRRRTSKKPIFAEA
jgi:hypothetical protein